MLLLALILAAAPDPATSPALALPNDVIAKTVAYRAAVAAVASAPPAQTDDALCALFDAADLTVAALGEPLSKKRDALFGVDAQLNAFIDATKALQTAMPGVRAAYGAAGMYVSRQDAELAKLARTPGARALLDAVAPLTTDWPAGKRQLTDDQGCDHPSDVVTPIENVTKAWAAAPQCLQTRVTQALEPRFAAAYVEYGAQFCDDEKSERAGVQALAKAVAKSPALANPKGSAATVRGMLAANGRRFNVAKSPL